MGPARADLFRLLGDEDRLRLLALCGEDELTVGELATLLDESQPQVSKKSQPLREAGLLAERKDGARTLLRTDVRSDGGDVVIAAAIEEGQRLCTRDGSLARVGRLVAQREELSRRLFDQAHVASEEPSIAATAEALSWLPLVVPMLPGHALAVDIGTGEGALLPILSPLYDRVVAVDRSAARLARCGARIEQWNLRNVRLREGSIDEPALAQEIVQRGGADLVVMARVLHHASRPAEAVTAASRLLCAGGHLAILDYLPHDDEKLREQGHVWLGFEPQKLHGWLEAARLQPLVVRPFPGPHHPALQIAVGRKPARVAS